RQIRRSGIRPSRAPTASRRPSRRWSARPHTAVGWQVRHWETPAPVMQVADALADKGWASIPHFLSDNTWRALAAEVRALHAGGDLRAAGFGKDARFQVARDVRADWIRWLDPSTASVAQLQALAGLDDLRRTLNGKLHLGLFEFEGHFSRYPAG